MAARIRRGDTVEVLTGKHKGRTGVVTSIDATGQRITVERVNIVKRHTRPSAANRQGGIIEKEAPIHVSNVALVHGGERTRVGFRFVEGRKVRWSKKKDEAVE